MNTEIAVIMGSSSDLNVMKPGLELLKEFDTSYHVEVVSAHRTPEKMLEFAKSAESKGFKVIIAGAGGAAHLPGMVASATPLPVIGVPVNITALSGLDSLLSIVQMPKGVPVATMAIDNSTNAALMALRMLAISNPELRQKLKDFALKQAAKVEQMNENLDE
jgi:phosphoribosylaminoimidazole carboxylase PurE protein